MSYQPQFTITLPLLTRVEGIAALRERIQGATVQVPWIPALQKDTRARNTHSSTAIEGNPLTLEEVRALEEGATVAAPVRDVLCQWVPPDSLTLYVSKEAYLLDEGVSPKHSSVKALKKLAEVFEIRRYETYMINRGKEFPKDPELARQIVLGEREYLEARVG